MKRLCSILLLVSSFMIGSCSLSYLEDGDASPAIQKRQPRWMMLSGEVVEATTKLPIVNMRVRLIKKSVPQGVVGWPVYDSICEAVTDAQGWYKMEFWYDQEGDYEAHCLTDSTLLPNPDYYQETTLNWSSVNGEVFARQTVFPLSGLNGDSVYKEMSIKSYSYITIKLKRTDGFEEPMNYDIVINNDTLSSFPVKFPILNSSTFAKTFAFQGINPVKVDVHLYRTLQSNKFLSKTITPEPMKLKVVEYEF